MQVRGYKIRLPLDVMLVASANPEDYTNRGRIITPLKDRFGSQIRTHYPLDVDTEVAIMRQEARAASVGDVQVSMPDYMEQIIATFSQLARASNQVNQRSGVSVRLSVSATSRCSARTRCAGACAPASGRSCRGSSDLDALAASVRRQGRDRVARRRPRRRDPREPDQVRRAHRLQGAGDPGPRARGDRRRSTRASSPTPARTCRPPRRPGCVESGAGAASRRCRR